MVGRIRVSRTFTAGQRSEIGRYEDPWEVNLPGLGIGMINEAFHIAGICQLVIERLKRAVEEVGSKRHSLQVVELSQQTRTAVQIVSNPPAPSNGGPIYRFLGMGHADPLDGWRCCSQKRVMSRPIQVRQH